MWHETQARLADALLVPKVGQSGSLPADARRFGIYRNNVIVGLRETLAAAFPTVAALLGEDCFNEAARRYAREHPPASPVLLEYGDGFPPYLDTLGLTDMLPYVADVARLDWLRHVAAHAADADPVDIGALRELAGEEYGRVVILLHPSLGVMSSAWPVVSIWQAHQQSDSASALAGLRMTPERAMIVRPALDVEVRFIGGDSLALLDALSDGRSLGEAIETVLEIEDADPVACLAGLFGSGAVAEVVLQSQSKGVRS